MTRIINGKLLIEDEADGKCELCGKQDELRPYGKNGERICYECGMENIDTTTQKFVELLLSVNPIDPNLN